MSAERYLFLLRKLAEYEEPVCFTMMRHEWQDLLEQLTPELPALTPHEDMLTLYGFVREAAASPADVAAVHVPPQYWRTLLFLIDPVNHKRTLN